MTAQSRRNSARVPPSPQTPRVWSRLEAPTCAPTRDDRINVGAPIRFARRVEPSNSPRSYLRLPFDSTYRSHIRRHGRDIPLEAGVPILSGSRRMSGERRRTVFHRMG
jgi:hypothetical protein